MFGFCPGKATWDIEALSLFKLLVTATETGVMLESGGLADQPSWWVEFISWFAPLYNDRRFANRAKAIAEGFDIKGMKRGRNK